MTLCECVLCNIKLCRFKNFQVFPIEKAVRVRDLNLIYALETQNLFVSLFLSFYVFFSVRSLCSDFELICTTSRTGQQFVWQRKKHTHSEIENKRKLTTKNAAHLNFYSGSKAPFRIQKRPIEKEEARIKIRGKNTAVLSGAHSFLTLNALIYIVMKFMGISS